MSLYADYIKEREGRNIVEDEDGFATFIFCGPEQKECYIVDIYVRPEKRKTGKAASFADTITDIARKVGCTYLSGSVDARTNGATESLWVLLRYGFHVVGVAENLIWFRKEL